MHLKRSFTQAYASVYERPRSDESRIPDLDKAIEDAATEALGSDPTAEDVAVKYRKGPQREREIALAMMAIDPSRANADAIVRSISHSRTAIEQYQALRAAQTAMPQLSPEEVAQLREAIESEVTSGEHFSKASARCRLAETILTMFASPRPSPPPPSPQPPPAPVT
jgi:hypothetical protein